MGPPAGAIRCTGLPATVAKVVRKASCRATILPREAASATRSSEPVSRTATGML